MINNNSKQLIEKGIRLIKEDFNLEILKVFDNVSLFRKLFNSFYYKDKLEEFKRKVNSKLDLLFELSIQKKEGDGHINNLTEIKNDLENFREDYIEQLINLNNDIPWLFSADNISKLSTLYTRMEEVIDDIECAILEVKENLTSNKSKKEEEEEITARRSVKHYYDDRNTRSFYDYDDNDEFLLTSALAFGAIALASEMNKEEVENSYSYDNEDNYQSSSSDYNDDSTRWGTNDYQSSSSSWYSDNSSYSDSGSSWSDSSSSYSDTSSW